MAVVSYFVYTLLKNVTDVITKCDNYFITKCDKGLLQNSSSFLLQNATILLQNPTVFIVLFAKTLLTAQQMADLSRTKGRT